MEKYVFSAGDGYVTFGRTIPIPEMPLLPHSMRALMRLITGLAVRPFRPRPSTVLSAINTGRHALQMEPLKDLPLGKANPHTCPIANALGQMVGVDGVRFSDAQNARKLAAAWQTDIRPDNRGGYVVGLPPTLRRFVRDFDLGAYPKNSA